MKNNKFIVIHGSANTCEEAILICGNALYKKGIVSEDFGKLCVEREKEYPTGLPTQIPTAIPHVKAEGISDNAICFLRLDKPVIFRRMDDDNEYVETDMIFNLAIKDPNEHLEVLQRMMKFLNNPEVLLQCKSLPDMEAEAFLQEKLN
ncbi:MAG: PTS sugar transporter subunit IIA [Anaerobutyricum sp.]|nr:PTS sugar transporter subunit IIA [Anaerobutyricum sp.]